MHPKLKYSVLATLAILAVIAMVMANNVTTVSAQQVLERAAAAQLSATGGQGIRHERIQVYENPGALPGEDAGKTSIYDNYTDLASGQYRYITQDADGNILSIGASDGDFTYFYFAKDAVPGGSLTIARAPVAADEGEKRLVTVPAEQNRAVFDQFNNNPRVSLEDKITRADGRQAYVLVNPSFQTQKLADGQEETIPTGITRMTFDAETYQLLESQIAVRKDGQDVVIYTAQTLVDELLPEDSPVAWDLSDLANVTFVDEPPADTTDDVSFETLSEEQLAGRAEAYVLSELPEGFTQEIVAAANQPADQPYTFEVNYHGSRDAFFGMQAIGQLDAGFVETNFYDSSYKTASGLVLYFSPSDGGSTGGASAILAAPSGNSFLLISSLPREQVQELAETLIPLQ